jgi:exonuclease SbcD
MKFLQTGDLHLGKIIYEKSLIDDQEKTLNFLIETLKDDSHEDSYDALIITGDVYDRSVPPQEAVDLFDNFLTTLNSDFPNLEIFIISGNHDSGQRLSFASNILKLSKIHIVGKYLPKKPVILIDKKTNQQIAVYQIPFLESGFFGSKCKTHNDNITEALKLIKDIHSQYDPKIPAILIAHLFAAGGISSESERIFIGGVEYVDPALFSDFTYTALGHLHKIQNIGKTVWYSGSPFPYSFDETKTTNDKYFLKINIVTTTNNHPEPVVEKIIVKNERRLVSLKDNFNAFIETNKYDEYIQDYLEIIYTDNGIVENPAAILKTKFKNLLHCVRDNTQNNIINGKNKSEVRKLFSKKEPSPTEVINLFLKEVQPDIEDQMLKNESQLYLEINDFVRRKNEAG